jgi:hypothetical protein
MCQNPAPPVPRSVPISSPVAAARTGGGRLSRHWIIRPPDGSTRPRERASRGVAERVHPLTQAVFDVLLLSRTSARATAGRPSMGRELTAWLPISTPAWATCSMSYQPDRDCPLSHQGNACANGGGRDVQRGTRPEISGHECCGSGGVHRPTELPVARGSTRQCLEAFGRAHGPLRPGTGRHECRVRPVAPATSILAIEPKARTRIR